MNHTKNPNNEPFGQKLTLSCRCTVPKWTLIGDNLICDKCKTTINVNYQLKKLIQAQETSAVPENHDENLSRILEVLMDIRNETISAKQVVEENRQLRSTLEKKEAQLKKSENNVEYYQNQQQSRDSLNISEIIKCVLECITSTENDLLDYSDNIPVLKNHIQTSMSSLKDKLEDCGLEILSHGRGVRIKDDDNLITEVEYESTGIKKLDGTVKQSNRMGCTFPGGTYQRIREKVTVWDYSPQMDESARPVTITFYPNSDNLLSERREKYIGDRLTPFTFSDMFPPQPHYRFVGWSYDGTKEHIIEESTEIMGDIDLYAVWSNTHEVIFHCNKQDQTIDVKEEVGYGETIAVPMFDGFEPNRKTITMSSDDDEEFWIDYTEVSCHVKIMSRELNARLLGNKQLLIDESKIPYQSILDIISSKDGLDDNRLLATISTRNVKSICFNYEDRSDSISLLIEYPYSIEDKILSDDKPQLDSETISFDSGQILIEINSDIKFGGFKFIIDTWNVEVHDDAVHITVKFKKMCKITWTLLSSQDRIDYFQVGTIPEYQDEDKIIKSVYKRSKRAFLFDKWEPEIARVTESMEYKGQFIDGSYEEIILLSIEKGYDTFDKICSKSKIPESEIGQILEKLSNSGELMKKEKPKKTKKNNDKGKDAKKQKDDIIENAKKYTYSITKKI